MAHMVGEDDLEYEGWRVAAASALGVFVSFASIFVYTFGIFLKPIAQEFNWSREAVSSAFGFAAIMVAVASPGSGLERKRAAATTAFTLLSVGRGE